MSYRDTKYWIGDKIFNFVPGHKISAVGLNVLPRKKEIKYKTSRRNIN